MRAERLLSLILTFSDGRLHNATALAREHCISVRSVYRDMELLSSMGLPLESVPGREGGFRVLPGYALDRSVLDEGELAAVAAALGGIGKATGSGDVLGAKSKLAALLARAPRRRRSWIRIELAGGERDKARIETLRQAIEDSRLVLVRYCDAEGQVSEREVEPIAVIYLWQSWYLWSWCRLREGFRLFKLSRIVEARGLLTRFEPRPEPSETAWRDEWESRPSPVRFVVEAFAAAKAEEWFGASEALADGRRIISVELPINEWLVGFVLSFGEGLHVLEPPELARLVAERAEKIWLSYKNPDTF